MAILSDEFYYQHINLDTVNTQVFTNLTSKAGDANGRGLIVTLTENGLQKDTTGISLNLKWKHRSVVSQGLDNFDVVDLSKGVYKITYPTEMNRSGLVDAFVQIVDSGKVVGTRNMIISVESTVGDDSAIESSNSFTALASALIEVQSWNARIDDVEQDFIDRANNLDATYPTRLVSVEQQLAETAIKTYTSTTRLPRKPVVSLRFDDGYTRDYTVLKPIADQLGVPITIAYITGEDNGMAKSELTLPQMQELAADGWEFVSHTVSTNNLPSLTDAELDRQLKKSKEDLANLGFATDTLIYPVGLSNPRVRQAVKKYYRAAYGTEAGSNTIPLRQFDLYGVHFHDYSLADLKTRVDNMTDTSWLILYGHSGDTTFTEVEQQKFIDLVTYIQSKNIDVMTCGDALKIYENALEIENDGVGESFKIGADGVPYSRKIDEQNHIFTQSMYYDETLTLIKIDNTTPITFFAPKKVTSTSFGGGHVSGITIGTNTNMAGTFLTYRLNDDDVLNYQVFNPYINVGSAIRYWTVGGWGPWRQTVLKNEIVTIVRQETMNAFSATDGHTAYAQGITLFDINSSGSTGFPATAGSIQSVISNQGYNWSYQIFDQYQSPNRFKRWATSDTTWSEFVKIAQAIV